MAWALAFAAASSTFAVPEKKQATNPKASPSPAPRLIEITGGILGVALFATLKKAREKMERFQLAKDAAAGTSDDGEREGGERMIWRLAETEYQWIVAWADKDGKIVKVSASLRAEKKKPFAEIGDLARAKMHNDSTALWIVQRPDGSSYRLVAKGPGEQAVTIYMYSLKADAMD
jgi:hypothetical protein